MTVLEKIKSGAYEPKADYREDWGAYSRERSALRQAFKTDLEIQFGLVGHENANQMFDMLWREGPDLESVFYRYGELTDLLD